MCVWVGGEPAAREEGWPEGQCSPHGDWPHPFRPQQLPPLPPAEGSGNTLVTMVTVINCTFVWEINKVDENWNFFQVSWDCLSISKVLFLCKYFAQIEKFFPHVLEKEKSRADGDPSFLSPEEFAFAKEWACCPSTVSSVLSLFVTVAVYVCVGVGVWWYPVFTGI